ncbi:MAG: aspartate aminotransferase family protein [Trueperaceae bacterium]|nr:aspartate aminotransferase family protein [Trueperaceae bacterium]
MSAMETRSRMAELRERQKQALFPIQSKMLLYGEKPLAVDRAEGSTVWDVEGNEYLDFFGGILMVSVGHANPEVVEATHQQLQRVQHTSALFINEKTIEAAERIAEVTPGRLRSCFFTNSGSEADETAVMVARMYTGNTDVIALRHAYSGRTGTAMSLTAQSNWRLGGVFDGSIKHVRNPYHYRAPLDLDEDEFLELCAQDLEETIATCTNGRIAAFMAEPIQGVGGFVVAPQKYFKRIEPIVKDAGGLMIIDEVQTGWGRTGTHWCGIEHWGIEPDVMTFAKGIANGFPVGCTITTPEVAAAVDGPSLSTFGGNPVAMAATLATLDVIEKNDLPGNAARQGARLRERLDGLQARYPFIGEVRSMGLMQGLELVVPDSSKTPASRAHAGAHRRRAQARPDHRKGRAVRQRHPHGADAQQRRRRDRPRRGPAGGGPRRRGVIPARPPRDGRAGYRTRRTRQDSVTNA